MDQVQQVQNRLRALSPLRELESDIEMSTAATSSSSSSSSHPNAALANKWLRPLGKPQSVATKDIAECLSWIADANLDKQDQIMWIIASEELRDWLWSSKSKILVVEAETAPESTFSPLSYSSAMLAQSLVKTANFPILTYFCGLHTSGTDDDLAGVSGMLKSLIGQLLNEILSKRLGVNITFLERLDRRKYYRTVDTLLELLKRLLQELPERDAVFIVIDSVSLLQATEKRDMKKALAGIFGLMEHTEIVFKVLLTDPLSSRILKGYEYKKLFVPDSVDGGKQGINDEFLDASTADNIRKFTPAPSENPSSEDNQFNDEDQDTDED